jgi:hypothetical protein
MLIPHATDYVILIVSNNVIVHGSVCVSDI